MKNLKFSTILVFCFLMLSTATSKHEYYVSVTKMEYVKEEKALQVITQIFIDDFEKLLRERYDESLTLAIKDESDMVEEYMAKYLKYKLDIKINTADVDFNFLGKEYKDDIVYCYLEILNVNQIKTLEVKNEVLFDIYADQQNILRTKINGKDKSFILISENNKAVLNFD